MNEQEPKQRKGYQPKTVAANIQRAQASFRDGDNAESRAKAEIIKRYGTKEQFAATFAPENQARYAMNVRKCINGAAPNLRDMSSAYGYEFAESWLTEQLQYTNLLFGTERKMSIESIRATAQVVLSQYGYLRATEIMLFLTQLCAGIYGKVFGMLDGMFITNALWQFIEKKQALLQATPQEEISKERLIAHNDYNQWCSAQIMNGKARKVKMKLPVSGMVVEAIEDVDPSDWVASVEFRERFSTLPIERQRNVREAIRQCFHIDIN